MTGTVKWFAPKLGYGFITGEDTNEYFCHYTDIVLNDYKMLQENDVVDFQTAPNVKGSHLKAVKVKVIEHGKEPIRRRKVNKK